MKKLLGWLALAFLLFYVLKNPTAAAGTARHLAAGLADLGTNAGRFLSALTGGSNR